MHKVLINEIDKNAKSSTKPEGQIVKANQIFDQFQNLTLAPIAERGGLVCAIMLKSYSSLIHIETLKRKRSVRIVQKK